jgi:hypothetical protein
MIFYVRSHLCGDPIQKGCVHSPLHVHIRDNLHTREGILIKFTMLSLTKLYRHVEILVKIGEKQRTRYTETYIYFCMQLAVNFHVIR